MRNTHLTKLLGVVILQAGVVSIAPMAGARPPTRDQAPSVQSAAPAQEDKFVDQRGAVISNESLPAFAKVYVAPIAGGFETYLIAGLQQKKVPLVAVADRSKADFEITGISESERAGWAKMLFMGSQQTAEQASIKITIIRTGAIVFAYSVNKGNSVRGKQSAAEACAKHIRQKIAGQ